MKKAIIFDMDGTMIDSEQVTFEGYQHVLKEYDREITLQIYQTFLGKNIPAIKNLINENFGKELDAQLIVDQVHDYMESSFQTKGIPVKKGLYSLLEYAKKKGYRLSVATSSSRKRATDILSRIDALKYFDEIVCGDEIKNGKPNPEIFLVAASKLNIEPKDAYVIEDAQTGIEAGFQGGFEVICIPDMKYPEDEFAAKSTMILDDLEKVIDYLEGNIINDFDFHMHSGYSSDGQFTCEELIEIAKSRGMKTIALADHDLVVGVKEIIEIGKREGIQVIPATELYTEFHDNDVHLLGYDIDVDYSYFTNLPEISKKNMKENMRKTIQKFDEVYGIKVDTEKMLEANNIWFTFMEEVLHHPVYSKLEVFRDYIPGGKRCDPAPVNFYWDKCQKGSPLYVKSASPSLKSSIDEIHKAGGLAIVAHPFKLFYHNEDYLKEAIEMGIDGLEAYSNYHTPEMNAYYERMAKQYNLIITCGSDFHGEKKPSIVMGEYGMNKDGRIFKDTFLEIIESRKK